MTSADQALEIVLANVAVLGVERVPILEALSRVLAEEIRSPRDIPGFDNSAMDGYAVRAADVASASESNPVRLRVIETVAAGAMPKLTLEPGQATRTMTGAPIAPGADAIIQVERTRTAEPFVEILASAERGAFVRPNSSAYALAGGIRDAGGEPVILRVARDTPEEVRERLSEALAFDVVLSTGGVSVGQFDHVKVVLDELGMRQLFHGVAQRPGRPLKFGTIGGCPIFGLPGNPVSTMVCFYLYARPALLKMVGRRDLGLPRVSVRCATDIRVAPNLTEFVRVKLERRDGQLWATPTGNQSSGVLSSLSRADALLIGPAKENVLKAGSQATGLLLVAAAAVETEAFFEERLRQ